MPQCAYVVLLILLLLGTFYYRCYFCVYDAMTFIFFIFFLQPGRAPIIHAARVFVSKIRKRDKTPWKLPCARQRFRALRSFHARSCIRRSVLSSTGTLRLKHAHTTRFDIYIHHCCGGGGEYNFQQLTFFFFLFYLFLRSPSRIVSSRLVRVRRRRQRSHTRS